MKTLIGQHSFKKHGMYADQLMTNYRAFFDTKIKPAEALMLSFTNELQMFNY